MAQKYVDERREPPVVIDRPPCPGLIGVATAESAGLVPLLGDGFLPRPPVSEEPRGKPVHAIEGALDLRFRVHRHAHRTRNSHDVVLLPRFCRDGD